MKTRLVHKAAKRGDERGFILILALVTMLAMTIIGLSVVMNMTTDTQLSRNERDAKAAFQLAEAGVNEAVARLHLSTCSSRYIGEISNVAGGACSPAIAQDANYRTPDTTWGANDGWSKTFGYNNANANRRSADGLNYTVTVRYLDERNPENYCDSNTNISPNNSGNASTVDDLGAGSWTCPNDGEIVMYGRDFMVPYTLTHVRYGKLPVYKVESTGTSNGTTRSVVAYIGASNLNTDTNAGINTNDSITWNGGSCASVAGSSCLEHQTNNYDTYLGDNLAEIINFADEKHKCKNHTCSASGDDIPNSGQLDDVVGDWGDAAGNSYSTLIYIDNAGGNGVKMTGLNGRGILIVTGDLDLAGNVTYEGLIYVLGQLTISGGGASVKNVTGGIMAQNMVTMNGSNLTVQYDLQTLLDVAKENSTSSMFLWKRL